MANLYCMNKIFIRKCSVIHLHEYSLAKSLLVEEAMSETKLPLFSRMVTIREK